jgi:hypothetical protein
LSSMIDSAPLRRSRQPLSSIEQQHYNWIIAHAKAFKEKYFNQQNNLMSHELNELMRLASKLKECVEGSPYDEKTINLTLQEIASLLTRGQEISTHEFLCSKLCSSLLHFFTFLSSDGINSIIDLFVIYI